LEHSSGAAPSGLRTRGLFPAALIPARDIQYHGNDTIDVYNPSPGGGRSDYVNVTITGYPAPVITAINPSSAVAGGFSFRLEVDGSGFVFGASVQWNGTSVNTDYYGPNKLVGAILGDLIANPGTAQITVDNLNQEGISNAVPFTITAPTMQSAVVADQTMALRGSIGNPRLRDLPGTIKSPKFLLRFLGWNNVMARGGDKMSRMPLYSLGWEACMFRPVLSFLLALLALASGAPLVAQEGSDPVSQALAEGDTYQSKKKFELARDAYRKADKLSHHTSAAACLKLASVERKLGDFSSALGDAKRALKAAEENKPVAAQAHLLRATLLVQMSGKPTDKKLREAEDEFRQALALDPAQPLAHFDLGIVLLKQGRDSEGISELSVFVSSRGADQATVAEARRIIASPIRARELFAPDFSFVTRENREISNASLRGKVVLLEFWGAWCAPCREAVPILRDLEKKYAGRPFEMVGISSDEDEGLWRTFLDEQHMDWPEYLDLSGAVQEVFKIDSFPTYLVLDRDGIIRFRQSGLSDSTQLELEEAINGALKRASNPALAAASAPPAPAPEATVSRPGPPGGENPATGGPPAMPLSGIEAGTVSGNIYKNDALGLSCTLPKNWISAKPESLHALNERAEAAAKATALQQHPELAGSGSVRFSIPKTVLYASLRGEGDGQRIALPSLRISAIPSRRDLLDPNFFSQQTQRVAASSGMKAVSPASQFTVNDHQFLRADFERTSGPSRICYSYVQTLARDYLLVIELFASSPEELQQIAAFLQSVSITGDVP